MFILIALSHLSPAASWLSSEGLTMFSNIPLFKGYSLEILPIVMYICIINSGIGYACYFLAMEKTSAQTASLVFFFKPILAPILALVLLHEMIPFNMLLGILFILLGSLSSILPELLTQKNTKSELRMKTIEALNNT